MGTPLHAIDHRSDNKLYKLQTPQSPIVRPVMYDHYNVDNYPLGTNAIVAVMSYTVSDCFLIVCNDHFIRKLYIRSFWCAENVRFFWRMKKTQPKMKVPKFLSKQMMCHRNEALRFKTIVYRKILGILMLELPDIQYICSCIKCWQEISTVVAGLQI